MGNTHWILTAGSEGRLRSVRTLPAPQSKGSDPAIMDAALTSFEKRRDNTDGDHVIVFFGPAMDDRLMVAIEDAAPQRVCRRVALEEVPVPGWGLMNAYGLTLKAFYAPKTAINLLPKSLRKKPSRVGQWMLVVLATAAVLTGLGWFGSHILQQRFMSHRLEAKSGN